jgi:hypothetical protein
MQLEGQKMNLIGSHLGRQVANLATCSFVAALLGSCVSSEQMQDVFNSQRPPTAAEKQAAITYIKANFFDPYSIRDASLSNVVSLGKTGLNAMCARFNAKNRMGGYVGLSTTSLRLQGGAVVSALQDAPSCGDERLQYVPFSELEGL